MRGAVLLAVAALAAGCGSAAGVDLDDAADATAADTSRFEMHYDITGVPEKRSFRMTASGLFDFPNERGIMSVDGNFAALAGLAESVEFKEFRLLGNAGYARWSVKGKDYWVKEDVDEGSADAVELLIPLPGTPTEPTDVLARVVRASAETAELGKEEVRGAETTHFRARVDLRKLADQLPPDARAAAGALDEDSRFVPVDIWIDGEKRLRRITVEQVEDEARVATRFDLFGYGVEVEVEPPPRGEVISQEQFDKLTGEGTGEVLESGDAEAATPKEACASARRQLPKKQADEFCANLAPGQPGNKESE